MILINWQVVLQARIWLVGSIPRSGLLEAIGEGRCVDDTFSAERELSTKLLSDFWELPNSTLTSTITDNIEHDFYNRCPPEKRPRHMRGSDVELESKSSHTTVLDEKQAPSPTKKSRWPFGKKDKPLYDESLFLAIHRTFFTRIWIAGILKLLSGRSIFFPDSNGNVLKCEIDTLKTTTPLLNKVILNWLSASYLYSRVNDEERATLGLSKPKGIGYGIGLAIALFVMQGVLQKLMYWAASNTFHRGRELNDEPLYAKCVCIPLKYLSADHTAAAMATGLSIRTGIIGSVARKSLRLSGRGRVNHSTGQITTMISTDATRLDRFSVFSHK